MRLCGDLRLFTQVLVEFWLQETRIRVVLHQAVYPFLGSCEAATCSFLYILGNQSFGLKIYVYLFWSFLFYKISIYFPCFWGQFLGWFGFWSLHRPARIQYFLHRIPTLKKPWMQQDHICWLAARQMLLTTAVLPQEKVWWKLVVCFFAGFGFPRSRGILQEVAQTGLPIF